MADYLLTEKDHDDFRTYILQTEWIGHGELVIVPEFVPLLQEVEGVTFGEPSEPADDGRVTVLWKA